MDPTEEGEENTIKVQVPSEMTREAVVEKILEVVGPGGPGGPGGKVKNKKDKICGII